jgi:hypothetical protein
VTAAFSFVQQEHCVMRVHTYLTGSFPSVHETGTFTKLIVECTTCMVNIIAVGLCRDANPSVTLLCFCVACLNCFGTVMCLMEIVYLQPFVHASENKVWGKFILKYFTN